MFDFKTLAATAARRCSALVSAILERRLILPLLYADDRMLRDIGLSRADVVESLSSPLRANPSQLLIERINGRREAASARRKAAIAANTAALPPATRQAQPLAA